MGGELIAAADVDRFDRVRQPELFEKDDGLFAVSGRPEIQVNHGISSCCSDPRVQIVTNARCDCPPCCRRSRRAASILELGRCLSSFNICALATASLRAELSNLGPIRARPIEIALAPWGALGRLAITT